MFDIGIWEFLVIGVLALLVFGPDKLPKAAADAGRLLRQLRQGAAAARSELTAAAGLEEGGELSGVMAELRDLDPRRILTDATEPAAGTPVAGQDTDRRTSAGNPPSANAPNPPEGTDGPPEGNGTKADPDWT